MAGIPNYRPPIRKQIDGSEYGGVQPTIAGGIQPKPEEALTAGERFRLGYVTGNETQPDPALNLEDRRQMMGLRPAEGGRPLWLDGVNPDDDPRLKSEARRQGFGED